VGLVEFANALRRAAAAFDASLLSGEAAACLAEQLAATEKACAAARVRAARRAAECRSHQRRGFDDAAGWLARAAGTSVGEARAALSATAALDERPATREALAKGDISLAQAEVIANTPGDDTELIALAQRSGLGPLKHESRRRRLAAIHPDDLHERQQQARELRHWRDDLGMVRLSGALPAEVGLPIVNQIDAETDRLRRDRAGGPPEPRAALAADALVAMLEGQGKVRPRSADLVIVCDFAAYHRGHAHEGEPCHIVGGGPLPVALARRLGQDAFLKAVLRDGVDIHAVKHFGRHISAELRTALELGPDLDGVTCVEQGCGRRYGLEWDHVNPVANGGTTSYDNLQPRCWPHHRAKTERDRAAGLLGSGP